MPPLNIDSVANLSAADLFGSTTDKDQTETGGAAGCPMLRVLCEAWDSTSPSPFWNLQNSAPRPEFG